LIIFIYGKQLIHLLELVSYAFFPLQSFRLAFALIMGALMFMMMSLRHGKESGSAERDIF